jgi:hypothetical protein
MRAPDDTPEGKIAASAHPHFDRAEPPRFPGDGECALLRPRERRSRHRFHYQGRPMS